MITEEVYMICTMDKNFMLVPVLPLASCLPWGELLSELLIQSHKSDGRTQWALGAQVKPSVIFYNTGFIRWWIFLSLQIWMY